MKIYIGDDFDPLLTEKKRWIKNNFNTDQYRIGDAGFTYPDYYVEFAEDRYATLFRLHWG